MDWLDLLAIQGTLKSLLQHHSSKESMLQHPAFFIVQIPHPYMTMGKAIALTRWTFVDKVMSLLFNMLSRLVIPSLSRSKRLLISWLQSPSVVILEPMWQIDGETVETVADFILVGSNTLTIWCEDLTQWKRPWCWEKLKAKGERDHKGWTGWMASLTRWTWVWASSGSWWWTRRPGVLQSMGLQRVGHDWVTELNWIISNVEHLFT